MATHTVEYVFELDSPEHADIWLKVLHDSLIHEMWVLYNSSDIDVAISKKKESE